MLDSGGRAVAGGPARPVAGRPLELRVPLAGLPAGGYTVTWRIVSAVDGHRTDGVFGFGVGAAGAPAGGVPGGGRVRDRPRPEPAGRRRPLGLVLGAHPAGRRGRHRPLVFGGRLGRPALLLGSALAAAAAGLVAMIAAATTAADVPVRDLLASTTGHWLLWRAATLAAALAATWWLLSRPTPLVPGPLDAGHAGTSPFGLGPPVGGRGAGWPHPLVEAAAPAVQIPWRSGRKPPGVAGGDRAAGEAGCWRMRWLGMRRRRRRQVLNLVAQWTHLLAVGVWIGGLVWLLAALWMRVAPWSTRQVVVRFSKLAGISLAVVVVTGVARSVDELGGWGRLVDSGFGRASTSSWCCSPGWWCWGRVTTTGWCPCSGPGRGGGPRPGCGGVWAPSSGWRRGSWPRPRCSASSPQAPRAARPGPSVAPALEASGADWATTVRVTLTVTPGAAGPNRFSATVADFDSGSDPARRAGRADRHARVPPRGRHRPPGAGRGPGRPLARPGPPALPGRTMEPHRDHPAPQRRHHRAAGRGRPSTRSLLTSPNPPRTECRPFHLGPL